MRRKWLALGAVVLPVGLALILVPATRKTLRAEGSQSPSSPIAKLAAAIAPAPPTLTGLDTTKLEILDDSVKAPLPDKKTAKLTVDPQLEKTAQALMTNYHLPEAAVVLMDVQTGKILVYASHVEKGPPRDLCVEATAPAASVFKVVTGSALVEVAGISPDRKECYSGGEQRVLQSDLVRDPKRDRWCTTVGGAMGRSINTVFARLALENLPPPKLEEVARSLGFGAALPFDVPVQAGTLVIPADDQLQYARTAAGFWNTTLSPIHAAWISATISRGGEPIRPVLVAEVLDEKGRSEWTAPTGLVQKRAIKEETAKAVTTMMETTVADGTSYKAFHDAHGKSFLPNITVAGKTGTLTDGQAQRYYTWFTGFVSGQVAVAALVVNDATWTIKANVLAREVLRSYFAKQGAEGVSAPSTTPATKHRRAGK